MTMTLEQAIARAESIVADLADHVATVVVQSVKNYNQEGAMEAVDEGMRTFALWAASEAKKIVRRRYLKH